MVAGSSAHERTSRRSFLGWIGAALTGAVGVGACGSPTSVRTRRRRSGGATADAELLNRLLEVEYHAIAAYTAATPFLSGAARATSKQFLGQEVLHADRLISLIQHAGGDAEQPLASYDLGHQQTAPEIMALLLELERLQLTRYLQVAPQLSTGQLKATTAGILANQAQHAAVWSLQLGRIPAPSALVTGS